MITQPTSLLFTLEISSSSYGTALGVGDRHLSSLSVSLARK